MALLWIRRGPTTNLPVNQPSKRRGRPTASGVVSPCRGLNLGLPRREGWKTVQGSE
jgi:hypothetical protein